MPGPVGAGGLLVTGLGGAVGGRLVGDAVVWESGLDFGGESVWEWGFEG